MAEAPAGLSALITQVSRDADDTAPTTPDRKRCRWPMATNDLKSAVDDIASETEEEMVERESKGLLGPRAPELRTKKCLVLDLDETLVHSSFKRVAKADFLVPVDIEGIIHKVYVCKRPFADEFLASCAKHYEIVLFTASLSKYADPLLDMLDTKSTIDHRLFREHCVQKEYCYVKDLSKLGRKLKDCIIIDNSAQSYIFQPSNAIPIPSWFDDPSDTALLDLIPVLEHLSTVPDVRKCLQANKHSFAWLLKKYGKAKS
jgi:RNA polymerase II subunit A small phosphatase-like protein